MPCPRKESHSDGQWVIRAMKIKKSQEPINRRGFFRLDDRIPIIVHRCADVSLSPGAPSSVFSDNLRTECSDHTTIDISAMGIKFFSPVPFTERQMLEITIMFRAFISPVLVKAVVLRSDKIESTDSGYQIAVTFIEPASQDVAAIERYIFERQRQMIAEKRIGYL